MSRAVEEWIGKTDNSAIPPRVKDRILKAQDGCCKGCGREFTAITRPAFDHIRALINGGENREGNLQALCDLCHQPKTAEKERDRDQYRQDCHGYFSLRELRETVIEEVDIASAAASGVARPAMAIGTATML